MGVPTAIHGNADLVGLAAQNLAELEVAKRNESSIRNRCDAWHMRADSARSRADSGQIHA
jgi:hypothetical protein